MKNLLLLLLVCLIPAFLNADPCPDDVTSPVITSKGFEWDCTFDIFTDSDTNFITVTEESDCGLKKVEIADWDMITGNCDDPFVKQYTVTWYAEDVAGNATNFTQMITITRPDAGDIVFPQDTMVQCPASGYEDEELFGYPGIDGNDLTQICGFRVKYKLLDTALSLEPGRCLPEVWKEWTVIESCSGIVLRDTQKIILIDTIRPIIACTALEDTVGLVIDTATCCAIYTFPVADAVDFCAPDDELVFRHRIDGAITGSVVALKEGSYEASVIVTDPCNNADTCNYVIVVSDESPPVVECPVPDTFVLSQNPQQVSAADLGITAADCSDPVEILYRFASQPAGTETSTQTFTCAIANTTVQVVVIATDAHGNQSDPITCSIVVTADPSLICPATRSSAISLSHEDMDHARDQFKAYYNGQELILHSETGVQGLAIYNTSGTLMWHEKWDESVFQYQGELPAHIRSGIYFLKINKINGLTETVKVAIF